jgi:hypothetical protein
MARGAPHGKHRSDTVAVAPTRPGRNGGTLRSGNPRNKGGGQKRSQFLELCEQHVQDPALWKAAVEKQPLGTLALSAEYTHIRPAQQHQVSGEITFTIRKEA